MGGVDPKTPKVRQRSHGNMIRPLTCRNVRQLSKFETRAHGLQQRTIFGFAVGPRPRAGQQDSGAECAANAAGLGEPLRVSSPAVGNPGGRGSLSRNLLSGCQLDPCWANRRPRSHGWGAQSTWSGSQRYLRLSVGARRAATAMRGLTSRRAYYADPKERDSTGSLSA